MADLWQFQSNLNRGELDPLLVGRIELQSYYNGVESALNMLSIPQGGMKKRPGTEWIGPALGNGRLENFSFNVEQNYLLVFTALRMQIYKDGVLQTNINGSGFDYLVTPYTITQIQEFDYIQSADTIIITHEDVETRVIARTSDTDWSITAGLFLNIPQFDFNDASSPTPTDEIQDIAFSNQAEGDVYKISLNQILTEEITWANDDQTNQNNIQNALLRLPNTASTGIAVTVNVALTSYIVTFSGASAFPWDLMSVIPVNTASATFAGAVTRTQTGVARSEDVWSSARGWPRTCTFHEGRLWLGGSKSKPNTLWGSRAFDFFNFDVGRAFDDEAIISTLDTDQVNAIEAVFSNRSLQVFTSGGEFYVPASPITPSNISVAPQSNLGSKRVRPVTIDGITLFIQRTGKALVQFLFVDEFKANQAQSISFLASHLIKNPVKQSVRRGTSGQDANYVFLNNDDGTLTVFNTLSSEEVAGFTRWETAEDSTGPGVIKSSAVVDSLIYTLVERVIGGSTVFYLEVESETAQTDSSVIGTGLASNTLTGLTHLNGETVAVKADGAVQADEVVSAGKITIDRVADTIEAGLMFFPEIKTMPLNVGLQNGPNVASKKKIARISLQLFESNGVIVNEQRLADRTIGVDQFSAPIPQTGIKRIHVLGWDLTAQVTITQTTPMPMTILNIGMEIKV